MGGRLEEGGDGYRREKREKKVRRGAGATLHTPLHFSPRMSRATPRASTTHPSSSLARRWIALTIALFAKIQTWCQVL
jgi:hypothetical protein